MKRRLLVVADRPNWAFDKMAKALKRHCIDWHVEVAYLALRERERKSWRFWRPAGKSWRIKDHPEFDLILYLCDWKPEWLLQASIPREKVIVAVRSNVEHHFYDSREDMASSCVAIAVCNDALHERFRSLHPLVRNIPGGVDTEKFSPVRRKVNEPPVVGWSGSARNFGEAFRGLDLIREACAKAGFIWRPALREEKWRNEDEMVSYYQNEIDIYVDASRAAGRQNGLIEAGACAKPLIASRVGIAEKVVADGLNGYLVERSVASIHEALSRVRNHIEEFGSQSRVIIEEEWGWEKHVRAFERLFDEVAESQSTP